MTFINQLGQAHNLYCAVSSSASKLQYSVTDYYIVGSDVDYTPTSTSSFVEYRYQFLANYSPDTNDLLQFSLVYDDTVALDPATQIDQFTEITGANSGWGGNVNSQTSLVNLRFTLPTWSGTRRLALSCRAYATSLRGTLHWTAQFREDDVDSYQATTNSFVFSPHLIVYSY